MNDASLNMTSSLSLSGTAAAPEAPDIREQMIDDIDYVLMPEEAWKILVREFGLTHGQAPIARKVRIAHFYAFLLGKIHTLPYP